MSFSVLQSCYTAPRSRSNPRTAQTNDTKRFHGYDGKLYHQDTGNEDLKYRTVTENDNMRDHLRSMEMTKSLDMMSGKIDSRGNPSRPKSAASYVPPKLGTTSKSNKVEKRAWEKEMGLTQPQQTLTSPRRGPETNDQKLLEAITTLQQKYEENLHVIDQLFLEKKEMSKKVEVLEFKLQKALSPQRRPTKTPSVPPRYSSKSPPGRKKNKMSSSLSRYHREDSSEEDEQMDEPRRREGGSRLNLTSPGLLEQHRSLAAADDTFLHHHRYHLHGGDQSLPDSNQISALEAAQLFAQEEEEEEGWDGPPVATSRSTKSFPTRSVYEPPPRHDTRPTVRVRPSSAPQRERNSASTTPVAAGGRGRGEGRNKTMIEVGAAGAISSSFTRSSSLKRSGPSPHIQADTDRYLQKKQFLIDEEERKKQQEKEEEIEREKRRQRAIRAGTAPNGMFSRDEMIRQKRLERQQKNQNRSEDEFLRTQQEYRREKLRNTRIRMSIDPSKTWEDVKREEEVKRKDRIERRKEELQQSSHYSESLMKSVEKWKTMKSADEGGAGGGRRSSSASVAGSRAGSQSSSPRRGSRGNGLSPEEVTTHLKRQQEKWEAKLRQQKLLQAASKKDMTPDRVAVELERRHEEYLEKRKKKNEEKKREEEEEKRRKEEEERKRRERLMRSGGGEGGIRLTKAMEDRVKAVRAKSQKREEEETREEMMRRKQEKKLKETSEFLRSLIKKPLKSEEEKENDLKRMVQEGREEYKAKYKENQQAIKSKLTERPSLIERHDQAVAIAAAGTSALNKVANAVQAVAKFRNGGRGHHEDQGEGGGEDDFEEFTKKLNWKSKAATDDIFDEEEKIQLGLRE